LIRGEAADFLDAIVRAIVIDWVSSKEQNWKVTTGQYFMVKQ